ncbi:hypothetical protein HBH98_071450 [Parastagonospora nodorum]|nr:hypothetical protein HBH51_132920 [Parastagonospora nodorum]KAH4000269.1 hypothetical protein HBI10_106820 [Parastagonospora nodorum]KAH4027573.1 hypothetical protein HBI09_140450 [Parastagonospora nodorum]KAH4051253.1 hypothetical protein HBH49_115160 [Parastagonospora nodorum]KAH4091539.1 hypothetical protein HBH48_093640 [Parastagonospora nodorum]
MPPFDRIRNFMFLGESFQALKDNVKNFTKNARDPRGEMLNILKKHLHPPKWVTTDENAKNIIQSLLEVFLQALAKEAASDKLSASEGAGIVTLQRNVNVLAVQVQDFWTQDVPLWRFYPLMVSKSRIGKSSGIMNSLAVDPKYERNVRKFYDFKQRVSKLDYSSCCPRYKAFEGTHIEIKISA